MITFSIMSKAGNRDNNEDYVGYEEKDGKFCFALADGLGGHGKGEVASQTAIEAVLRCFREDESRRFFDVAFPKAQEDILEKQRDPSGRDMKTTLVAVTMNQSQIQWAHIGDSRLYYFLNGKIVKRTLDHSVPQMLVAIGEIKEKQIRSHPDRNRLLKVLGTEVDELNYQVSDCIERAGKQGFLLCSDGFWELIDEKHMEKTWKKAKNPEEWVLAMEQIVCKNGKNKDMDNYSAIVVWIE